LRVGIEKIDADEPDMGGEPAPKTGKSALDDLAADLEM
jgi:hypothetical protein